MSLLKSILKPVLMGVIIMLAGAGFSFSDEIDDSALFVEAFTAYQKKDYLLTIEKIGTLQQLFPDSPLQDVTLLLLARAGIKSGYYELAAKSVNQFNSQFPASPLKTSIEEELKNLGNRLLRGEQLQSNMALLAAARKVRSDNIASARIAAERAEQERLAQDLAAQVRLAREKAEAERREQERLDQEKAVQARLAREKAEAERREQEQLAAEKAARESIKVAVSIISDSQVVEIGKTGTVQFEVANQGKAAEDFVVQVVAPVEYGAVLAKKDRKQEASSRIRIGANAAYRGTATFRMPNDKVDGHKGTLILRAASARFSDIMESQEAGFNAAAPLVRVVAKPVHQKVRPGDQTRFRITLLNAGSLPARNLAVRVSLPPQADFLDAPGISHRREAKGVIAFKVNAIESGMLTDFWIDVKVREDCSPGQELRSRIEVINAELQTRETFPSSPLTVEAP